MLTGGLGLLSLGSVIGGQLLALMRDGLSIHVQRGSRQRLDAACASGMRHWHAGLAAAPLLGLLLAAALLAPLAIGGWTFSSEALVPNFERLNPIAARPHRVDPRPDRTRQGARARASSVATGRGARAAQAVPPATPR